MHLDRRELAARIGDARFGIRTLRRHTGGRRVGAIPALVGELVAVGGDELQGLDGDRIASSECPCTLRGGDDRTSRAVRYPAAIEHAEWPGDHRGFEHLRFGDRSAQMRLRGVHRVGVALDRHMRHGALEIGHRQPMLGGIGGGQLRERTRRCESRLPKILETALGAFRESAETGVLELLDAHGEGDVASP